MFLLLFNSEMESQIKSKQVNRQLKFGASAVHGSGKSGPEKCGLSEGDQDLDENDDDQDMGKTMPRCSPRSHPSSKV